MKVEISRDESLRLIIQRATSLIAEPHDKERCQSLLAGIFDCGFVFGMETNALYDSKQPFYFDEKSGLTVARLTYEAQRRFLANLRKEDLRND